MIHNSVQANVSPKELQLSVKGLETVEPGPGLIKSLLLVSTFVTTSFFALSTDSTPTFIGFSLIAGLLAAALFILTHDAIHHTLTGWKLFDDLVPRIISAPLLWVHGLYSEIHKIHHKMNGDDLDDPERVQWTEEEYLHASKIVQFYVRNQWFFDIFVFAGLGMIYKTTKHALKKYHKSKAIRRQSWLDMSTILLTNTVIYTIAIHYGLGLKYLLFWIILERTTGAVVQWRAHIEHYGLWGKSHHFFETQVFNCRNIETNPFMSWYLNRLNYHSVHHAFPKVPFYNLKIAHLRFMELYKNSAPMVLEEGYFGTTLRLATHPTVIGHGIAPTQKGQKEMIAI